jgi:hypothetical protein
VRSSFAFDHTSPNRPSPMPSRISKLLARRAYDRAVAAKTLSLDTSAEIERLQIERWRQMSPESKAALVSGLTQAGYDLALAGLQQRYPRASSRELFLRLALLTLGPDLARQAYPEIADRDLR